jgi:hypothetical protein
VLRVTVPKIADDLDGARRKLADFADTFLLKQERDE